MKLGMNVRLGERTSEFISVCHKAGINDIRLLLDFNSLPLLQEACDFIALKGMSMAVSPSCVDAKEIPEDAAEYFLQMSSLYAAVCETLPVARSLGVTLPVYAGLIDSPPTVLKSLMADLSLRVKDSGHRVVMPMQFDDLIENAWNSVYFDIVDIDMMLTPALDFNAKLERALAKIDKPFWFGKAGVVGGYSMPSEQIKTLSKLFGSDLGASHAFMWSKPRDPRWQWSQDGVAVIDMLAASINQLQTKRIPDGDPVLQSHKARTRS